MEVLGSFSRDTAKSVQEMLGAQKAKNVLLRMQKAVLSNTLHIARTFKICVK